LQFYGQPQLKRQNILVAKSNMLAGTQTEYLQAAAWR
jgi:hypothetical protein